MSSYSWNQTFTQCTQLHLQSIERDANSIFVQIKLNFCFLNLRFYLEYLSVSVRAATFTFNLLFADKGYLAVR